MSANQNVSQETLELAKTALSKSSDDIAKTISTSTGLVPFDLQAPAKNLYPVNTPIRNKMNRVGGGVSTATNWKTIKAILGSGFDAMGWVPEGQRTARMSYSVNNVAASYVTIGEEDSVTFEAVSAGRTFEDVQATASMRVLQKMMLKEENAILGGNMSVSLGTPATPTLSVAGSSGTLPAATYSVIVVALTLEGFRGASLSGGVPTSLTITGADGQTYTLSGGSSNKSAAATQAVTLGQILSCSTTAIRGAMGYAWYTGTAGNEKLEKITTINSVTFSAPLAGTGQAATAVTADNSANANYAFDGLLYTAFKSGSGAYINTLATGTPGTGTVLTASSRGTINEIDTMLKAMWDQYQLGPTVLYVNSQELLNITNKALTGPGTNALLQIRVDPQTGTPNMMAGGVIGWYFNPFAMDGGYRIPIMLHPALPAGTIIGWCGDLPAQYKSNNVPEVANVKTRVDYYQLNWPLRTRAHEFGVYAEEVLAVYVPFGLGVITNIANG
jgi:hypothetical protein